jgi:hypothetical protein
VIQDGIHSVFDDSPISQRLKISDVCVYGPGDLNKLGKEGKTSWDSFSYALMMGHNVWHHINAVQTANELYDQDQKPGMLAGQYSSDYDFRNIVEEIFHHQDRERSLAAVEHYRSTCDLIIGTRGRTGKRMFSATTMFNSMFEFDDAPATTNDDDLDPDKLDELEATL